MTHGCGIPPLLQRQLITSRLSRSISFFATNTSQFFSFLAIPCMILWKEPVSQLQFSIQANFVSLSLICLSTCWICPKTLRLNFLIVLLKKLNPDVAFPNFSPKPQPQLDTICAEPLSRLGRPSQLSVQGSFGGCFSVSERMHSVGVSISFPSRLYVVATDSLSNSAPVSWRPGRPDT